MCVSAETVGKLASLGFRVNVEAGAGAAAGFSDDMVRWRLSGMVVVVAGGGRGLAVVVGVKELLWFYLNKGIVHEAVVATGAVSVR